MAFISSSETFSHHTNDSVYLDDGTHISVCNDETTTVYIDKPVDENVLIDIGFSVYKAKEDEGLVSGWANVALDANGEPPLDWQGDIISPEVLEKAAIGFMMDYRESGVMHDGDSVGTVVESIVLTKEKQEALGIPEGTVPQGWFITVKVHDKDVFAKVKDGTYKMFSIQGSCKRVKQ